jgi:hypothetical protein
MKSPMRGKRVGMASIVAAAGCVAEVATEPEATEPEVVALVKPSPAACPTVTALNDIDVARISVRGDFRVNGAAPLPYDTHTATIELRSATLGSVELGALHERDYKTWVLPGVYDVVYKHAQGDIVPANAETLLLRDVALTSSTVLDIDIPSVLVMGDILIDGSPAPSSLYEQGNVRLRDRNTGATFTVGRSMDGSYFAMVIPGVYDVIWSRSLGGSIVPVNTDALVAEAVTVAGLTELDIDVPTVLRTGAFKLDGVNPPLSIYENGMVSLRDPRTGEIVPLGETRLQTYSKRIVPGTYDVIYSHMQGSSIMPRNAHAVVATAVDLTTEGDLAINIPVVTLRGDFSLDGGAFPQGIYNRARFWLRGMNEADQFAIGVTADSGYEVRVIPGTYSVVYEKLQSSGIVPENKWAVVSTGHQVQKAKGFSPRPPKLDIAVASGLLAADVTIWGQPPPVGIYHSAQIRGVATGDPVVIGTTNAGGGNVRVLAGTYDLRYAHLIGSGVPRNGDARVGESSSSPLLSPVAVDLQPGTLSGAFTQNGQPFPAAAHHGTLSLRDMQTGDVIALGATSNQTYSTNLLGSQYEIVYDYVAGSSIVANRGAILGCIDFTPPPPLQGGGLH